MQSLRLAPGLLLFLLATPLHAEPRVIGRTESDVRVLRGGTTAPDSLEVRAPGLPTPSNPVSARAAGRTASGADAALTGPAPARTAPEALALARSLVTAFGGKAALTAWIERGERRGTQTVHLPAQVEATFVERRAEGRVRMDMETSGLSMSVADTPVGGWQRFLGLVSDLPDAQKDELARARSHDEGLLLLAAAGEAPAKIVRDRDRDALAIWGPSGSATLFVPGGGVPLAELRFTDRAAMSSGEASQVLEFSDWRAVPPNARVPFAARHLIAGQLVEESALTSVDLTAAYDDSVFARPGASERTIGPSARSVLPLTRVGEHHFAQVSINGGPPRTFLIDTGAGLTAISRELADTLGLAVGDPLGIVGLGGGVEARSATLAEVGFGSLTRRDVSCLVLDFAEMRRKMGLAVEGILGFSALNRYAVTFDFAAGTLELAQNAAARRPGPGGTRVPMQMLGGQALVDGSVDGGAKSSFILDTGSWISFVPRSVGRGLRSIRRVPGISFVGADGRVLEAEAGRARGLAIGAARIDRPVLLFATGGGASDPVGLTLASGDRGVLGANVLRRFRVTLDYPRGELVLDPSPAGARGVEEGLVSFGLVGPGIVVRGDAKGIVVRSVVPESPAERAGVRAGDRVLTVEDRPVDVLDPGSTQALLSGPVGTSVRVRLKGAGGAERGLRLERVALL
ncbi:MAG: aspartyl protease family protein [Candidatus Eisenbacteria bacterium]